MRTLRHSKIALLLFLCLPAFAQDQDLRASYRQETAALVENLVSIGRKRIAVFYQADAYGRSGWEALHASEVLFSEERLQELLEQIKDQPADDIVRKVVGEVRTHAKGVAQSDDVTVMAIRYRG